MYTRIYTYILYYAILHSCILHSYTHYGTLTLLIQPNSLVSLRLVLPAVDGHSLLYIYAYSVVLYKSVCI